MGTRGYLLSFQPLPFVLEPGAFTQEAAPADSVVRAGAHLGQLPPRGEMSCAWTGRNPRCFTGPLASLHMSMKNELSTISHF